MIVDDIYYIWSYYLGEFYWRLLNICNVWLFGNNCDKEMKFFVVLK